jgi:hypothetical protein
VNLKIKERHRIPFAHLAGKAPGNAQFLSHFGFGDARGFGGLRNGQLRAGHDGPHPQQNSPNAAGGALASPGAPSRECGENGHLRLLYSILASG